MMGRRLGFVVAVLVVVAACGGGVDDAAVDGEVADAAVADASGGESAGTAEGLEATVREIAGLAFTAPAELYDFLSAECTGSVSVTEWVAEAEAAQALLAMMFGDAEIVVSSVSTRNVTSTSGEASFSVLINGEDAGGGDSFEPYVFEDGGWKRADCGSLLGGESSSAGFEVDVEASVGLDAGDTTTAEPESTENDVLLAAYVWNETSDAVSELQVLLGETPDGNYGPKTRAAHLAELNTRGLSTDNVPDQPDQQPAQPEAASPSVSEPDRESVVSPAPVSGSVPDQPDQQPAQPEAASPSVSEPDRESVVSPAPVSGSWTPTCVAEYDTSSNWEEIYFRYRVRLVADSAGNTPDPDAQYRVRYRSDYLPGSNDMRANVEWGLWIVPREYFSTGNLSNSHLPSGTVAETWIKVWVGDIEGEPDCAAAGSMTAP